MNSYFYVLEFHTLDFYKTASVEGSMFIVPFFIKYAMWYKRTNTFIFSLI